jgi:hypothetical protein
MTYIFVSSNCLRVQGKKIAFVQIADFQRFMFFVFFLSQPGELGVVKPDDSESSKL